MHVHVVLKTVVAEILCAYLSLEKLFTWNGNNKMEIMK